MRRVVMALALACFVLLPAAAAGRPVDETHPMTAGGSIGIELVSGNLRVIGWDRAEMKITGTLGDEVEKLDVSGDGNAWHVEVVLVRGKHIRGGGTELEVRVPVESAVEVETVSGGVSTEGTRGALDVEAVSGEVVVSGALDTARISVVSGNVKFRSDRPVKSVQLRTVSGNVDASASLAKSARVEVEAFSGDVDFALPSDVSAEFRVSTFSGNIKNDFGGGEVKKSDHVPSRSLSFTTGSGDARVSVSSFSGSVRLVKR